MDLMIDIETYSSVDIGKAGSYKYAQSPDFEILLLAYKYDDKPTQVIDLAQGEEIPDYLIDDLMDPAVTKHAYNAAFEIYCLNQAGLVTPVEQWRCTMVHGMYAGYPAGLAAIGKAIGLPEEKQKMAAGKALIRYFCQPCKPTKSNGGRTRNLPHHEPEKWKLFKEYNIQDVETEYAIEQILKDIPMPDSEIRVWHEDIKMNTLGVKVDRQLVQGALAIDETEKELLTERAKELTGLENPGSNMQVLGWLQDRGIDAANVTKATVADLLAGDLPDDVREFLGIRQMLAKTSVTKYDAMARSMSDSDDRVRGLLQYYGASRTGRYAGRLVQVQNLPRNYLSTLDEARGLVKAGDYAAIKMLYGDVSDTLSQLIRTAFVPSQGGKFIVSDFSAIEARVIAWLAGEEWVNKVFRTTGRIYEATAARMFHVEEDLIRKGNPEYALRQKGKIATLALGYQGGPGALIAMGADKMGIPEEDLGEIVQLWRKANPNIVRMWYAFERCAKQVITDGGIAQTHSIRFALEQACRTHFMTIQLPSGRKLYYHAPYIDTNGHICHYGQNQTTRKWEKTETYGGKLTENCLAEGTMVLTSRGIKPIERVAVDDLVYDGVRWVRHEGVIEKGVQPVISVDGIMMTADHRVYTAEGWKEAHESKGFDRYEVQLAGSHVKSGFGWPLLNMEREMLVLWADDHPELFRDRESETENLRMQETRAYRNCEADTRDVKRADLHSVAQHETEMRESECTCVEALRRKGYKGLSGVVEIFRGVFRRHGGDIRAGADTGQNRCERRLLQGELPVGDAHAAGTEHAEKQVRQHTVGADHSRGSIRQIRDRQNDPVLQTGSRSSGRYAVYDTGCSKPVYDLKNCGPRHCFTVIDRHGRPMLVHNCVQAIARDCLVVTMMRLIEQGYVPVMHIHDEVVIDATQDQHLDDVNAIFAEPIPWAPGLVLKAAGFESEYYMKD